VKASIVPAANQKWEIKDLPQPEPGPNQVLIKMHASGICYTDVHQTKGELPGAFPRTLGHEPVGEIISVGAGVRGRKIGDRVGVPWVQASCMHCEWCLRGKPMFCAEQIGTSVNIAGGHAEYMLAFGDATVPLPEKLSYEQAAPIFCAGYTVYSGLRWAEPEPHETVAVVGIGGLGHLALQYAKAAGFKTIAITHSPDKETLAKQLGADEVVKNGPALAKLGGADVILGTSNSTDSMADAIQGLRPDGRFVLMGFEAKALPVSPGDLIMKRIRVLGSQQNRRDFLYEALDFAAQGKVKVMTETYPFDQLHKAYDRVAEGKARFRAVLTF
jgi:alcohol dehydrogenase